MASFFAPPQQSQIGGISPFGGIGPSPGAFSTAPFGVPRFASPETLAARRAANQAEQDRRRRLQGRNASGAPTGLTQVGTAANPGARVVPNNLNGLGGFLQNLIAAISGLGGSFGGGFGSLGAPSGRLGRLGSGTPVSGFGPAFGSLGSGTPVSGFGSPQTSTQRQLPSRARGGALTTRPANNNAFGGNAFTNNFAPPPNPAFRNNPFMGANNPAFF